MAIKAYLYREDEEVFKKIQDIKQRHKTEKFSTKDAITYLINKGYDIETIIEITNPEILYLTTDEVPHPAETEGVPHPSTEEVP